MNATSFLRCLTTLVVSCLPLGAAAQFAYGPTASTETGFFDGYQVIGNGYFTPLAGSPFQGGVFYSSRQMIANSKKDLLYIYDANGYIDTFKIAPNGQPKLVGLPAPFTPVVLPGAAAVFAWLSFVSGDGKYVYILDQSVDDGFEVGTQISVLRVQKDGSVTYNPNKDLYDFGTAFEIVGDPAGKFIFGLDSYSLFGASVAADGSLHPISMPQLPNTSFDTFGIDPDGNYFYVFGGQQLAVFSLSPNGTLTQIPGSPFSDPQGRFNVFTPLVFDPNEKFVYGLGFLLSDSLTIGVYAFEKQAGGRLVPVAGSPFSLGYRQFAANLVIDPKGRFLTVNVGGGTILQNWVFEIQSNGALKPRANSPSPAIPSIASFVGQ
jgi:hypothetical protein